VIYPQCLLHHGIFFASLGDSGEIRADNHDNCFMHWIGNSSSMHNDSMWERIHSLERGKNRRILVPFICGTGRLFDESFHILGLQRCGRELATHTEQFSGWQHLGNHMEEEWVVWLTDAPQDYLSLKLTCKWNLTEGKWISPLLECTILQGTTANGFCELLQIGHSSQQVLQSQFLVVILRRPGQSRITTPRKESDTCKILSGVGDGQFYCPLLM
jgi:hypothetical protein